MNQEIIQKVRWLQQAESHSPCFRTGKLECKYKDSCCFAEICLVETNIKPLFIFEVKE